MDRIMVDIESKLWEVVEVQAELVSLVALEESDLTLVLRHGTPV